MTRKFRHLAKLLDAGISIFCVTLACAGTVYALVLAIYDFVFHVYVSVAHLAAFFVGSTVCCILLVSRSDRIRPSLDYLRKNAGKSFIKRATVFAGGLTLIILVVIIAGLRVQHPSEKLADSAKPIEMGSPKPIENARTEHIPITSPIPWPRLEDVFFDGLRQDQLKSYLGLQPDEKSALAEARKRSGMGGPGYRVEKGKNGPIFIRER